MTLAGLADFLRWMLLLAGFWVLQLQAAPPAPGRVVSINLCTDQLLLMLARPNQILSLSYLSTDPFSSFMAEQASHYPLNHAKAEELIALSPDLILANPYSPKGVVELMRRLGYRVEEIPMAENLSGIRENIERISSILGNAERGEAIIEAMDRDLAKVADGTDTFRPKGMFYQPRGYTSGSRTLQDDALKAAGWVNLASEMGIQGYRPIDLETLLLAKPDQLFTSSYGTDTQSRAQRQLEHPALKRVIGNTPVREIDYRYWICGGPMIVEAVEALASAKHR